jgi:hypothetical protein
MCWLMYDRMDLASAAVPWQCQYCGAEAAQHKS